MKTQIRYGLLGASNIARSAHIPGIAGAENSTLLGVASRRESKARSFAAEFNIPRAYGSYEEMLADPEIDAVLITLPIHAHCEWILKAAAAKKHVLCEKPMANSNEEMESIIDAAEKNEVRIMEAFSHRFPPHLPHLKALIDEGRIGELKLAKAEVIYPTEDWAKDSRADPKLGGCVTVECGCYCANFMLQIFADTPLDVSGYALRKEGNGVDSTFAGILRFPKNRLGMISASMETCFRASAEVIGDAGRIEIPNLFAGKSIRLVSATGVEEIEFEFENRFVTQIRHFSDCLLNGESPRVSLAESLETTRLLMRLKEASSQ